jgi:hypothetical protein
MTYPSDIIDIVRGLKAVTCDCRSDVETCDTCRCIRRQWKDIAEAFLIGVEELGRLAEDKYDYDGCGEDETKAARQAQQALSRIRSLPAK